MAGIEADLNMAPSSGIDGTFTSGENYVLARIVDCRRLHASKLKALIKIHWKLKGWILVAKQDKDSFLWGENMFLWIMMLFLLVSF